MQEVVKAVMAIEAQFNPLPTDIILSSFPKTGTTWLKALTVAIQSHSSRRQNEIHDDPLLTHNPHELVPFLEMELFGNNPSRDIDKIPSPREFNTHLPYSLLPDSIKKSGCRIIYIAPNPMDTFVSNWHFFNSQFGATISIEEAFDEFCGGVIPSGPFFDHVLEYWVERGREVCFFITYEELKEDPKKQVKRLAEFLGFSLSLNEIEEIILRCSHDRLSKLDVNKNGGKVHWSGCEFGSFFR
ncbi:hypothetical protein HHK36_018789 [Tetracentron sinense]|uniref:Sulfotransferase n=1 Tax=Tetracentron sinense TaxID=13715 RepID=A0A834Z103_TETSI|nr:hypothetical protein HHK36_018789 [Tetracentron sinense]